MKNQTTGFILVLVLWVLLALTVSASALAIWITRTTDQAIFLTDETRGQIDRFATLETLKFLLATRPLRIGGLYLGDDPHGLVEPWWANPFVFHRGEWDATDLPLDGRKMRGLGETVFSLQDEQGLLNANDFGEAQMEALLGQLGLSLTRRPVLIERLRDYTDYRPGHRLLGARDGEYRMAGLPDPPNRYLLTPMEARKVLGWRQAGSLWEENAWRDKVTVLAFGSYNLNTVPPSLLKLLPGLGARQAQRIVVARESEPFRSVEQANQRVGLGLNTFEYHVIPGDSLRVRIFAGGTGRGMEYLVRMTPDVDNAKPWRIEYASPVNQVRNDSNTPQIVPHALLAPSSNARRYSE